MDPASITATTATIIKIVSNASLTLHTFVNETRNIDQTVQDLAAEVDALKGALLQIDSVLKEPRITSAEARITTDEGQQLWQALYGCLEECQATVVRLDSALDSIRRKGSNWAKQVFRQVKLNLKKDEISSLRVQIHAHHIALSTALQMVNLRSTYLAPGLVTADLGPRVSKLQQSLDQLLASVQDLEVDTSRAPKDLVHVKPVNTKRLHSLGNRILLKASTVSQSSVGDGSVYGDRASRERLVRTMEWVPEPSAQDHALSMTKALSDAHRSSSSAVSAGIGRIATPSDTYPCETDIIDSDAEAEFEYEIAHRLLEKGKSAFESLDYQAAVVFLQKSVAKYNRLPQKLRLEPDPVEIPLMIATCKYHLDEIDEASNDLTWLIRQESSSDQDAIRKCQISHLLSQICLIKDDVKNAEDHCRNSLKGRRRLLGKSHQDYFASLALLSEICLFSGNSEEAAVYQDLLPPGMHQTAEIERLRQLMQSRNSAQMPNESSRMLSALSQTEHTILPSSNSMTRDSAEQLTFSLISWTPVGHLGDIIAMAFLSDGSLLASASHRDGTVRLWDPETGQEVQKIGGHRRGITAVAFSPDRSLMALVPREEQLMLWDLKVGRWVHNLTEIRNNVAAVSFLADGLSLATLSYDGVVRLWDLKTGLQVMKFEGKHNWKSVLAFSPSGSLLASGSSDVTIQLRHLTTGREQMLKGHTGPVRAMAFSPNSLLLASGSLDGAVKLWDPTTGLEVQKLAGHRSEVKVVAFSSDSLLLASGSEDKTLKLWDLKTGREVQTLEGHSDCVTAVAFSPDVSLLATGSIDGKIRFWRARDGWNS